MSSELLFKRTGCGYYGSRRGRSYILFVKAACLIFLVVTCGWAMAADVTLPGVSVKLTGGAPQTEVTNAVKIFLTLTLLSLVPALLVVMTSFTRIIMVLGILRHALGMQQTPPNTVLIGLALFLTIFSMLPTIKAIDKDAFTPFMSNTLSVEQASANALTPLREFMVRQTREQDLALMVDISRSERPGSMSDIDTALLVPAFMLSELRSAFQIGFVIFLPFLLIDIVVASILMSMGMLMVPPMMISLPIKILMFVLIDGWNLVVSSLMSSFR